MFPKGSNDRYTVGEFFSVPVFTNIIQDTVRKLKKTTLKTKVANTKCRFSATILMHHGSKSCVLCEKHASETQDAQVKYHCILSKFMKQTIIV